MRPILLLLGAAILFAGCIPPARHHRLRQP